MSAPQGRTLEHPLPAGMRDLLPEEARSRRALGRMVLERFALHGYDLVMPPAFEFADVLERGLGTLDPADVLRFVEPESGEVAALRPDMTPQVARIIATRLADKLPPHRLSYEGTVLRRRSGRARKHRQIPQVGVELAGSGGPDGDLEVLAVAADALRAAGLSDFVIDLGDAGIVRALLDEGAAGVAAPEELSRITDALQRKDITELEEILRGSARGEAVGSILVGLLGLSGGKAALLEGRKLLAGTGGAEVALARLEALFDAATARGLAPRIEVDLGEVRGFAYYTGPIFHIYAEGPGDPVGAGGRYDELLARFGAPMPAVGFALDLDRLAVALRVAGRGPTEAPRVVVVGPADGEGVRGLRAAGIPAVAVASREAAEAYARSWAFRFVVDGEEIVDLRESPSGTFRYEATEGALADVLRRRLAASAPPPTDHNARGA